MVGRPGWMPSESATPPRSTRLATPSRSAKSGAGRVACSSPTATRAARPTRGRPCRERRRYSWAPAPTCDEATRSHRAEPGATGKVARYSWMDHYEPLRTALGKVQTRSIEEGWRARVLVDDNALVDRGCGGAFRARVVREEHQRASPRRRIVVRTGFGGHRRTALGSTCRGLPTGAGHAGGASWLARRGRSSVRGSSTPGGVWLGCCKRPECFLASIGRLWAIGYTAATTARTCVPKTVGLRADTLLLRRNPKRNLRSTSWPYSRPATRMSWHRWAGGTSLVVSRVMSGETP